MIRKIATAFLYTGAVLFGFWVAWQIECFITMLANYPLQPKR